MGFLCLREAVEDLVDSGGVLLLGWVDCVCLSNGSWMSTDMVAEDTELRCDRGKKLESFILPVCVVEVIRACDDEYRGLV